MRKTPIGYGKRRSIAAALLLSLSPISAQAAWWWPFGYEGIDYKIDIQGVDEDTMTWFEHFKLTHRNDDNPPKDITELEQEGVSLADKLRNALNAHGYYDAQIDEKLDKTATPPVLRYDIKPGPRYRLSAVSMGWQGEPVKPVDVSAFPMHVGDPVDAEAINKQAIALQTEIGKAACLLSLSVTPLLKLDKSHGAALIYQVSHGPRGNFGPTIIRGNQAVSANAIRRAASWKEGKCYDGAELEKTRGALIGTQLFASVKVEAPTALDANGEAPVGIDVKERVPRTVTLGGSYATDQGFGVKAGWEHRNFFGDAEKLNVDGVLAEQEQSLTGTLRIPGWQRDDQTLVFNSSVKHEDTDAYQSHSVNAGAALERKFAPHVNTGIGLDYLISRAQDIVQGAEDYGLVYAPAFAEYDSRDNAQDARKGVYGRLSLTPYLDTFDPSLQFFKTQIIGQAYLSSEMTGKPTLALRASLGSISGASSIDLPPDQRFYAGGGGSVRGYSYQSLSPYANGAPIGGTSLVELSSELRLRFTEEIGGVAFVDAGNAYSASLPRLGDKLYYGVGTGVRYYSPVGPLRLDVAFPVNGSDIRQTGYALYVSIGQAF